MVIEINITLRETVNVLFHHSLKKLILIGRGEGLTIGKSHWLRHTHRMQPLFKRISDNSFDKWAGIFERSVKVYFSRKTAPSIRVERCLPIVENTMCMLQLFLTVILSHLTSPQ